MNEERKGFESWAVVEVLGHQTYAGFVSEEQVAGTSMLRVDVPELSPDAGEAVPAYTKFIGGGSIYALTPVSEEVARAAARRLCNRPISVYMPELYPPAPPKELPETTEADYVTEYDDPFQDD
ncbi:MAG: hypothetical protein ACK47B_23710 [Armatimonadota bacterium]